MVTTINQHYLLLLSIPLAPPWVKINLEVTWHLSTIHVHCALAHENKFIRLQMLQQTRQFSLFTIAPISLTQWHVTSSTPERSLLLLCLTIFVKISSTNKAHTAMWISNCLSSFSILLGRFFCDASIGACYSHQIRQICFTMH